MTRGYTQSEIMRKAVELYKWLVGLEAKADGFSYSYVPGACARSGLVIEGEHVHKRVLGWCRVCTVFDGMRERNVSSWNSLLGGYVWCQDVDGAQRIFNEMPERNVAAWSTMIVGVLRNGC
ncbi:unnamed protein product [Malus baccata var. baccata]